MSFLTNKVRVLLVGLAALSHDTRNAQPYAHVVVLTTRRSPDLTMPCPSGHCTRVDIDELSECPRRASVREVDTVVLFGHSFPGDHWIEHPLCDVTHALGCFPFARLVVMNTCFGAAIEPAVALAAQGLRPRFVGVPSRLPQTGLSLGASFWSASTHRDRLREVSAPPAHRLQVFTFSSNALDAAMRGFRSASIGERKRRLIARVPHLARVRYEDAEVVVVVSPADVGE